MREDVVMPAMARRLQKAGLIWQPQMGDWCTVLGGGHVGEAQAGLWLVAAAAPGFLGVMDAGGQWPLARVPAHDYVWLPSAGKMKTLLRARGYRVATREQDGGILGMGVRHLCRAQRPGEPDSVRDGEGPSEAEAVAGALLQVLADQSSAGAGVAGAESEASGQWPSVSDAPTRRL